MVFTSCSNCGGLGEGVGVERGEITSQEGDKQLLHMVSTLCDELQSAQQLDFQPLDFQGMILTHTF